MKEPPFLDLSDVVSIVGEEGLLGLAFDPNYGNQRSLLLSTTSRPGVVYGMGVTHVARFRVSSNPGYRRPRVSAHLLTFDQPQSNHNGGWIGFSPRAGDGDNLYIASGDGGASSNDAGTRPSEPGGNAQNLTTFSGKCCASTRSIEPSGSYSIPADNPFVGMPTPTVRRSGPTGCVIHFADSFDRLLGTFFIGDVGPGPDGKRSMRRRPTQAGGPKITAGGCAKVSIQNPAYPDDPGPARRR